MYWARGYLSLRVGVGGGSMEAKISFIVEQENHCRSTADLSNNNNNVLWTAIESKVKEAVNLSEDGFRYLQSSKSH